MSVSWFENSHEHLRVHYGAGRVPATSSMLPSRVPTPNKAIGAREGFEKRRMVLLKFVGARQEGGDGVALSGVPSG